MLEKITTYKILKKFDSLQTGLLEVVTPDDKVHIFAGKQSGKSASLILHDWSVLQKALLGEDVALADCYRAGMWSSNDLANLIELLITNRDIFVGSSLLNRIYSLRENLSYLFRLNTLKGSRKNIQEHYDLGNEFYSHWLDTTMTYSSALFNNNQNSLESGQYNKYQRIVDSLDKNSGQLIEIGCGWGGFAEHISLKGDYAYKGITLSNEQHDYAQKRLGQNSEIVLEDYRDQSGKYDYVVSIEMFEAVGEKYWQTYFRKLSSLLKTKGKAVIQTITINDQSFPLYRKGSDFIRSHIFPGGMLPSPTRFKEEASVASLKTQNEYFFGQDYAKTLEHWLENFDENIHKIKPLGFDESFIRLWRLYLASCIAGFRTGHTNVMQVELSHE